MQVNIKEVLIHDQSMSVQTKAAMLQRSVLDAWTDEIVPYAGITKWNTSPLMWISHFIVVWIKIMKPILLDW